MFDLLIIGGGINGVGIAADAAGRGLSVLLCEQGDLASGTSSASSKLIHGGLRYLEYGDFRLVRECLKEREILTKKAPHLITPMRFIMPHNKDMRSTWLIRLGLSLYNHLGGKTSLGKAKKINLTTALSGAPLKPVFKIGFSYPDCAVDDTRLVIANAIAAAQKGATILTHHQLQSANRHADYWQVILHDPHGKQVSYRAKMIINAAGPWAESVLHKLQCDSKITVRLVKGSHIIVPKLYDGDHAYILQQVDGRVVFVIPWHTDFNLIGTTEIDYQGDPDKVKISMAEEEYLCTCVNNYFKQTLIPQEIRYRYSGVRPLIQSNDKNIAAISRDYHLELNEQNQFAPVLSVFGGKITNYRKLAEHALAKTQIYFPQCGPAWTAQTPLPGGDIAQGNFKTLVTDITELYPWLEASLCLRYCHAYGTLTRKLLANSTSMHDLGKHFGAGLYQREIEYLIDYEWAETCDDILWRRTKLGLYLQAAEVAVLKNWLAQHWQ